MDIQTKTGQTPLIVASGAGKTEAVRVLLDHGANVNFEMQGGVSALDVACVDRQTKTVQLLLESGSQKHLFPTKEKPFLNVICGQGHAETVRVLVKHGAPVNFQEENGRTPLLSACVMGHVEVVKVQGADPDIQDAAGTSPLFEASTGDLTEAVRLLLDGGAIPDLPHSDKETPLECCRFRAHRDSTRTTEREASGYVCTVGSKLV